jgi:hypothetical protein
MLFEPPRAMLLRTFPTIVPVVNIAMVIRFIDVDDPHAVVAANLALGTDQRLIRDSLTRSEPPAGFSYPT